MRLVEHHQVVGAPGSGSDRFAHPFEHALAGKGIHADDEPVARGADEWIAGARIRAARDAEWKTEKRAHFPLPVADQASRGNDENTPDEAARQHLAKIEARHDGLAGPGIVGEEEAER